jgi:ABC-type transporter Mla maintaining outer membrane lipid asymmetry permease subunit MlaE
MSEDGLFQINAANVPFAILPGLVLMFTLAPVAAPSVPFAFTGFFSAFIGAMLGLLVYRQVRDFGPLARIGALTALLFGLWGIVEWVVR